MDKKQFIELFKNTDVKAEGIYEAQLIAKACLKEMANFLKPGMSQKVIHDYAAEYMTKLGSEGWWIHNDPALVLFGELTSYSAHEDCTPLFEGKSLSQNEMITIDVAPMVKGGWGDLTRSFFLKDGKIVDVEETGNKEWIEGMKLEKLLHKKMKEFVNKETTFAQLHNFTQNILNEYGYHNCDYHGNFGHTIENNQADRVTIVKGEDRCIYEYGKPFTYEPHICKDGYKYGMKHEIMYVFIDGKVTEV